LSVHATIIVKGVSLHVIAEKISGEIVPEFIEKLAEACLNNVYSRAPWRSGFLAMSVTKRVDGNTAQVGPTASYAKFVSLGTRPHEIRPRNPRVLAFPGGSLGVRVFAVKVHHPGTQPNPYLHLAAEDTREQVFDLFNSVWMHYMRP
jgi:hypothetical protein